METLKPQFTPGQVITSPPTSAGIEEKLSHLQIQQELDNRELQIRDLGEKLETLKIKRQEDKEKLKDYDKLNIQVNSINSLVLKTCFNSYLKEAEYVIYSIMMKLTHT